MYRYPKLFYYPKLIEKLFVSLMPNISHGPEPEKRIRYLLEAILDFKENGLTMYENLELICEWKEEENKNHKLLVKTTCKDLVKLTSQYQTQQKFTPARVREALHLMEDFLEILDDHRIPPKQGNKNLHFTLSLWSRNKINNLEQFTQQWTDKWNEKHSKKSKHKSEIANTSDIVLRDKSITNDFKKNIWSNERIEVLYQALRLFTDIGKIEEALSIADLILERDELSIPLRTEIETFLTNHKSSWRQKIDEYINLHQPFRLFYKNAKGEFRNFSVHYAKIVFHEERQYLDCWCEETEGNRDLEPLRHNWSFRLDRISEATFNTVDGKWLNDLETINVEMYLFGSLFKGYKSKGNTDIFNRESSFKGKPARKVLRKVSNTFWFFREITRYGKDCEIISPPEVRSQFKENLKSLCQAYDLETM